MILYNILRLLLYMPIFFISIFSQKTRIFFRKRLLQNFSDDSFSNKEATLIHLSSVGEFNLSQELIGRMSEKGEKIIISVMTDTGFSAVQKASGENRNIKVIYFPLDDYFLIRKLYKSFNITKTVVIETEIWFNLYSSASRNGKLLIVNGRLTDKRLKSYLKIRRIVKKSLNRAKLVMVQSREDEARYRKLGVLEEKIKVYKNLKYSIPYETMTESARKRYYESILIEGRKIIVCGSTRPGEEKIWFEIFKQINRSKEFQLIIVPRHLERVGEIIQDLKSVSDSSFSLLSENEKSESGKTDILIVDRMGVLRDFYQLADFVFVGGTLVNIGGHSILEPLYYGKLPIIGKYYQNIEDIVKDAMELGFVKIVENRNEIIEYIKEKKTLDTSEFFRKNNEIDKILNELT